MQKMKVLRLYLELKMILHSSKEQNEKVLNLSCFPLHIYNVLF